MRVNIYIYEYVHINTHKDRIRHTPDAKSRKADVIAGVALYIVEKVLDDRRGDDKSYIFSAF